MLIPLSQGYSAVIDEEDWPLVSAYRWHTKLNGRLIYATRNLLKDDSNQHRLMHRLLLDAKPGESVDHIDGDGLNNRRSNLRKCTHMQNKWNETKLRASNKSGFKGVSQMPRCPSRWVAHITVRGRNTYIGSYRTPEEAARAYDCAAYAHYGEFAAPNFR